MNISVFLDDALPINGPLMFIPGYHVNGAIKADRDEATTSYPIWALDNDMVTALAQAGGGISAPTGQAGGLLIHHGNLIHGSAEEYYSVNNGLQSR